MLNRWEASLADAQAMVEILEEETPLGVAKSGISGRVLWYRILILISDVSGKIAKDKRKNKINDLSE